MCCRGKKEPLEREYRRSDWWRCGFARDCGWTDEIRSGWIECLLRVGGNVVQVDYASVDLPMLNSSLDSPILSCDATVFVCCG